MFFCKSIIPWELLRSFVQEYESTGLANTGHNAKSDWFGPAVRDPPKNHIAACPPPPYHFWASVHFAWLSRPTSCWCRKSATKTSRSRDPQSMTTHPSGPSRAPFDAPSQLRTSQGPLTGASKRGGAPEKVNLPQMGCTEFRPKSRSLSRPPGGLARDDNIFGSSESVTLRMKRQRNRGNEKFLPSRSN